MQGWDTQQIYRMLAMWSMSSIVVVDPSITPTNRIEWIVVVGTPQENAWFP